MKLCKKALLILLLLILVGCSINNNISVKHDTSGTQTFSIKINKQVFLDYQLDKDRLVTLLEENKPIDAIVIAVYETEDEYFFHYSFDFQSLEDYQNISFLITNQEINLTLDLNQNPINGTSTISLDEKQQNLFITWIEELIRPLINQEESSNIETTITYQETTTTASSTNQFIIEHSIPITKLEIKTELYKSSNTRYFKFYFDEEIEDNKYLNNYISNLINSIEFLSKDTLCEYYLYDNSINFVIKSSNIEDLNLLTNTLFNTSSKLSIELIEDEYYYTDFLSAEDSIFGAIINVNYYVKFPNHTKLLTVYGNEIDEDNSYYGILDINNPSIKLEELQDTIEFDLSYKIDTNDSFDYKSLIRNTITVLSSLILIFLIYKIGFKKRANKIIDNEFDSKSVLRELKNLKKIETIKYSIFYFILFILISFIILQLISLHLYQLIYQIDMIEIYESLDLLSTNKMSISDFILLLPLVYGGEIQLRMNYVAFGSITLKTAISFLMLTPLMTSFIVNMIMKNKQINPSARFSLLTLVSFMTSLSIIILSIFRNAQQSSELEMINYNIVSLIVYSLLNSFISNLLLMIFDKSIHLLKPFNTIKPIIKVIATLLFFIIPFILYIFIKQNELSLLILTGMNLTVNGLSLLSGGIIMINNHTYSIMTHPYILIITFGINYYLYFKIKKERITPFKTALYYAFIVSVLSKLFEIYYISYNITIGILNNRFNIVFIFILTYLFQLLIHFNKYKITSKKINKQL